MTRSGIIARADRAARSCASRRPRRRRCHGRAPRARIAAASHRRAARRDRRAARRPPRRRRAASPSGTSSPVSPSATIARHAAASPGDDRQPAACASSSAMPNASLTAGQTIEVGGAIELLQRLGREHADPADALAEGREGCAHLCLRRARAGNDEPPRQVGRDADSASARHAIGEELLVVAHHGDGEQPWRRSRSSPSSAPIAARLSLAVRRAERRRVEERRQRHQPLRRMRAAAARIRRRPDWAGRSASALPDGVGHGAMAEVPAPARLLRRVGCLGEHVGNAEPLARPSGRASPAPCDRGGR